MLAHVATGSPLIGAHNGNLLEDSCLSAEVHYRNGKVVACVHERVLVAGLVEVGHEVE